MIKDVEYINDTEVAVKFNDGVVIEIPIWELEYAEEMWGC